MTDAECEGLVAIKKREAVTSAASPMSGLTPSSASHVLRRLSAALLQTPVELRSIAYRHRWTNSYAALLGPLDSICFSVPTLTLICFGLASDFFGNVIFRTPLS